MLKQGVWMLATIPALVAGWTDWRWRRIPNWLTVPALLLGIAVNCFATGWAGAKESLLGAGLGLGLLLPFVLIRSLGAGDWKLVGALGAFLGPSRLITVLLGTVLVAGLMAVVADHLEETSRPDAAQSGTHGGGAVYPAPAGTGGFTG